MIKSLSITLSISLLISTYPNSTNQITLNTYELKREEYIKNTPPISIAVKEWIYLTLSYIKKGDSILEIGSGFGQDAKYIESLGYKVKRTDAVKGFINILKKQGYEATLLNVLTDELEGNYSLIFANSVLHHFNLEELQKVLNKINKSLQSSGILSFCVKKGSGEKLSEDILGAPRYFCYHLPLNLKEMLMKNGFEVLNVTVIKEDFSERMCIVARKTAIVTS